MVELPHREGQAFAVSNSHHVSCFKLPRKLGTGASKISIEDFVDDYLQDGSDDGSLLPERREEILAALHQAADTKTPKQAKSGDMAGDDDGRGGDENIMTRLKAATNDVKAEDATKQPAKKKQRKGEHEGEFDEMLPLYQMYHKAKLGELKDILKWNKQIMAGVKDFVLFKVIDGALHGRLGLCPLCQGDLKFVEDDYDTVHCRGRYDEDIGRAMPCSYNFPRLDKKVPRLLPFYLEEPTEDQKEAMTKEREDAREDGEGAASNDNPVAKELLEKASALDLDLNDNKGKKKAAVAFVELVQGKIDLPENRNATMEIGKLIMSNQGQSPKQIMEVIIAKYGFANVKEEKAAAKEAAAEAACANPKNAPLILAFKECAKVRIDAKVGRACEFCVFLLIQP